MPKRIVMIAVVVFLCLLLYKGSLFLVDKLDPSVKVSDSEEETIISHAIEWPQFHGPNRDNCSAETGLLKSWPLSGPKLLWKYHGAGNGWSSPTLAGGYIFVTGAENEKEFLSCL